LQQIFSSTVFESRFWKQKQLTCFRHAQLFTWFMSIFFQHGGNDNHRCVVHCCYWPPASCVILDAYPTFMETRCPLCYTIPSNFMQSIMNFGWGSSSKIFNFMYDRWSLH
jgi:hypothetical protein